jgi:hypothetical protein
MVVGPNGLGYKHMERIASNLPYLTAAGQQYLGPVMPRILR